METELWYSIFICHHIWRKHTCTVLALSLGGKENSTQGNSPEYMHMLLTSWDGNL